MFLQVRAVTGSKLSTQDLANLRTFLLTTPFNGAITHELLGTVWIFLLRLRSKKMLAENRNSISLTDLHAVAKENAREQIERDVERTRTGISCFKQPDVLGALLRFLSLFCDRQKVS